jgi:hypothetical protein
MTRTEKEKLKKKSTLYMWLALASFLLFIIITVITISKNYISIDQPLVLKILILVSTIITIILTILFNIISTECSKKLYVRMKSLRLDRDLIRITHFYNALKENDYKTAKFIYYQLNDPNIIRFCNGMLTGLSTNVDIDKLWGSKISNIIIDIVKYPD